MRSLKRILSLLLSVIILLCVCAPFSGAVKAQPSDELTFGCDWFNESYTYPFSYDDSYFPEDFSEYDHELAVYSISASMASFTSFDKDDPDKNIEDFFDKCGFETVSYGYETEGYDTVGLAIGSKEIDFSGEKCTVLMIVVRSGNYGMEWGGNFRLGKGDNHLGFDIAKATALGYLNDYAGKNDFNGRVRAVVTGYSRGGSIAELMAAELDDGSYTSSLGAQSDNIASLGLGKEDLCAYAFEPPQCTRSSKAQDGVYSNIFNVINPNDYVPKFVGDIWGFTHFGRELFLPCAENTGRYGEYYEKVCTEFDYIMEGTGKTANECFYSTAMSRSFGSMIDYVMDGFSNDVLKSRDYYVDRFESGAVFIAGQYLGKKLGAGDVFKTAGVSLLAALICLTPENIRMIKSDGYQRYLAHKISESDAGQGLTEDEVDSLLELLVLFTDYMTGNRDEVAALVAQLKNVMYVHQPYVNLAWMRSVDADDIKAINSPSSGELEINCESLTLRKNAVGKLCAENADGRVSWRSSDPGVAVVDSRGYVKAVKTGTAVVTAAIYDAEGGIIATDSIEVRVESAFVQMLKNLEKRLLG